MRVPFAAGSEHSRQRAPVYKLWPINGTQFVDRGHYITNFMRKQLLTLIVKKGIKWLLYILATAIL